MKHIFATIVTIFVMMGSALAAINQQCPQHTAAGAPVHQNRPGDQELCRTNYAVIHSCQFKNPIAVMEHITPAAISGSARRQDDFREDPAVSPQCRSRLPDYAGQPYDRGHMSAAAGNTQTPQIMSESFFLSNMVPQVPNNNRGIWRILEMQIRDQVVQTGQSLYVISGAIFAQGYTTIGNGVGVPTHLYKVIINRATGNVTAYLMPNTAIPVADLPRYRTTVQAVEQATGMKFPVK
jgi:endonuclease G